MRTLAKDVCMQIAAAKPEYLDREAVPAERVRKRNGNTKSSSYE